jgi:hypothetical protein
MAGLISENQKRLLWAVALRLVPEAASLDAAARDKFFALVEGALSGRSSSLIGQFKLFLAVLQWIPVLRFGLPLTALSGERQDAVLRWFQEAPYHLIRKGFWGLKTMLMMGYYGQPETWEKISYRPSRERGNELLHERTGV